jgi:hypothetical protein
MVKKFKPLLFLLLFSFTFLSGCKLWYQIRYGDPRKNCNHPEHGKYMNARIMQKQKKAMR